LPKLRSYQSELHKKPKVEAGASETAGTISPRHPIVPAVLGAAPLKLLNIDSYIFMLKTCTLILFYLLLNAYLLPAQIPIELSFSQLPQLNSTTPESLLSLQNELSAFHQQTVKIRGFLYCNPGGQWILASEPNLKTCCIGSSEKIGQQITLSEPILTEALMHAITVQGIFVIDPIWIENGSTQHLQQIYRMDAPVLINTSKNWVSHLILVAVAIIPCLIMYLMIRFRNRKPNR
jgi:hypothetical protein